MIKGTHFESFIIILCKNSGQSWCWWIIVWNLGSAGFTRGQLIWVYTVFKVVFSVEIPIIFQMHFLISFQVSQSLFFDEDDRNSNCGYTICIFTIHMSRNMWFQTMWYVWPTKAQTSLPIRTVWPEPSQVARIFYDSNATDRTSLRAS